MNKNLLIPSIALLLLAGCKKNKTEETQSLSGKLNAYSSMPKFKAEPIIIGGQGLSLKSNLLSAITVLKTEQIPFTGSGRPQRNVGTDYRLTVETDEQVVLDSYQRLIYPGSLIKGNSVPNLNFDPVVGVEKLPITVSVSIPAVNGTVTKVIENPNLSTSRTALNEILSQNINGDQVSSFSYDLMRFTTYDELKLSFGANVKIGTVFNAAFKDSTTRVSLKTGLIAKFIQRNFTVDMDIPNNGQLLANNVDPNTLGNYSPVYVSSITYGRMGIIAIESSYDYEAVRTAFNVTFNFIKAGGGVNITSEQKRIIEEAQMSIYTRGGQGLEVVKSIKGYDAFVEYIISGGKFSVNTPGVPLFFTLNYLSDHTLFKTIFNVIQLGNGAPSQTTPTTPPGGGRGGRG